MIVRRYLGEDIGPLPISQADKKIEEALFVRELEIGVLKQALHELFGGK